MWVHEFCYFLFYVNIVGSMASSCVNRGYMYMYIWLIIYIYIYIYTVYNLYRCSIYTYSTFLDLRLYTNMVLIILVDH